jgi:hypothetical protein
MTKPRFEFGKMLKDVVTNFQGIATARIEFMTGCTQYGLTPPKKTPEDKTCYFDETRLIELKKGHVTLPEQPKEAPATKPGGPSFAGVPARHE